MAIKIVVAYGRDNRVIGRYGGLPWGRIPADLKHFKETTLYSPIIMGRKTWESLGGKPLHDRYSIILSGKTRVEKRDLGSEFVNNIEKALIIANEMQNRKSSDIFVIGGANVFTQFLCRGLIDEVIATEIHKHYDGDVFFPSLVGNWQKETVEESKIFDIVRYTKEVDRGID